MLPVALLIAGAARGEEQTPELQTRAATTWESGIGSGFTENTIAVGLSFGAGIGTDAFGSTVAHDLALGAVGVSWIFTGVQAPDHWYRGNWEWRNELFGGSQINPDSRYLFGWVPLLRYDFATGTRWVPFLTVGAGLCGTDIDDYDLSGKFQFCPQAGFGTHYFVRDNLALTAEFRWMHLSNAGLEQPNRGVNTAMFYTGVNWFF